ncbi:hypothetical protein [Streptomyces sp. LN699]|uniref:hypothetical protein n=1 Tax=Streptomyces sp. LN699 TaxID=3112981 RepID=UPI00371C30F6
MTETAWPVMPESKGHPDFGPRRPGRLASTGWALGEPLAAPQVAVPLLLVGGFGTYIAFLHPAFGIAPLVGISGIPFLQVLLK